MPRPKVSITQIVAGQWSDDSGAIQYSILGLGTDHKVYRWDKKRVKWVLWKSQSTSHYSTLEGVDIPF